MASSALSRLESLLAARKLDGTVFRAESARNSSQTTPTGLSSIDEALGGGWPRGELSDVVGAVSSGRSGVMAATLAAANGRGDIVALVDAFDRFDPVTAAAAGVDLSRLLWVRGPALTLPARPGVLSRAITQAVRAFDLILRAGGFGVVVLDVAGAPARAFNDLAPSTWLRLAHVINGQQTAGLLMADRPLGRSARGVTVRLTSTRRWTGSSLQSRRLDGLEIRAEFEHAQRIVRPAPKVRLQAVG
jgi:hypothetical protein